MMMTTVPSLMPLGTKRKRWIFVVFRNAQGRGKLFNLYPDMKMFIQIFTSSLVDRYSLLVADEWMYLCSFRYLQFQHPLRRRGIEHLQDLEGYTHWRAPLTKLHPGKRTCPLKNSGWKTTFLLKWPLFSGHVSFEGCILKIIWNHHYLISGEFVDGLSDIALIGTPLFSVFCCIQDAAGLFAPRVSWKQLIRLGWKILMRWGVIFWCGWLRVCWIPQYPTS